MPTTQDYMEFLFDQISTRWNKRYKKMFGEYMLYINEKPVLLVCDNTVYVKKLSCISPLIPEDSTGFPYKGAKKHYIVDIEDKDLLENVISELEKVLTVPDRKKK